MRLSHSVELESPTQSRPLLKPYVCPKCQAAFTWHTAGTARAHPTWHFTSFRVSRLLQEFRHNGQLNRSYLHETSFKSQAIGTATSRAKILHVPEVRWRLHLVHQDEGPRSSCICHVFSDMRAGTKANSFTRRYDFCLGCAALPLHGVPMGPCHLCPSHLSHPRHPPSRHETTPALICLLSLYANKFRAIFWHKVLPFRYQISGGFAFRFLMILCLFNRYWDFLDEGKVQLSGKILQKLLNKRRIQAKFVLSWTYLHA